MAVIKKFGIMSVAKLEAILMAIAGLIMGIFYAIAGAILGAVSGSLGLGAGLGFLAIIILPVAYGIFGFIGGAVGAWLYNLIAGWVGGIEIEFDR